MSNVKSASHINFMYIGWTIIFNAFSGKMLEIGSDQPQAIEIDVPNHFQPGEESSAYQILGWSGQRRVHLS
jgi:hypothetical protein